MTKLGSFLNTGGKTYFSLREKKQPGAGTEAGSREMQKQEGSPKPSSTTAKDSQNQLLVALDAVSLYPREGSAVFTLSPWANCHSAIMQVVETIPLTRREACDVVCLCSPSNTPIPKCPRAPSSYGSERLVQHFLRLGC